MPLMRTMSDAYWNPLSPSSQSLNLSHLDPIFCKTYHIVHLRGHLRSEHALTKWPKILIQNTEGNYPFQEQRSMVHYPFGQTPIRAILHPP